MLADALGLGEDFLVAHEPVNADRGGGGDHHDVGQRAQGRAAKGELLDAGRDRDEADESGDEPGVPLDQAALVPARKAEAGDAVRGFHFAMVRQRDALESH